MVPMGLRGIPQHHHIEGFKGTLITVRQNALYVIFPALVYGTQTEFFLEILLNQTEIKL